ncbi:gliding motility-associated protein GldE [Flavobacterium arcticum]|uniref:Gliding motility-associated protein GldE n=1 Tax=Flavobacterium arcticum TaxID=1784713 RepID=A0A345HBZ1_9FLAO|nr:gliding motility-associated protein GldE [Flavobacterium arcticum]AXG74101.1 gliding motility-associated protein GldE [Flavobacterium arcticum]KAF2507339.1 gliding motility-associated protein GldE [Flavobacterium arcticum]
MDPDPSSILLYDYDLIIGCAGIIFLLFCSAFISGTEVAIFLLSPEDINIISEKNPKKGNMLVSLLERPKKLLATIVITNTFINIAIIILFFRFAESLFYGISIPYLKFTVEVAVITFLILLFGEVVPKVYATRNNRTFSSRVAYLLFVLNKLLSPISVPMREITLALHKKFNVQPSGISVDQLSQALELTDYGDATAEEQKILEGIVTFGNTDVRQVMSPRIDIFALDIEETFSEIFPKIVESGFSRIPVFRENIDQIVGVLFIKDLIPHIDKDVFEWQELVREAFFIPENKKLDNLLKEFQGMKNHLAIVVDEYGGTSGLISLEDILEEIVGDISDEFDDEDIIYSQIDEKNYLFDGKISLKDFYRITDVEEEIFEESKGEAETLAGFVLEISGNFPKKAQKITFNGNIFTIESVDKRRIKQIKVTLQ